MNVLHVNTYPFGGAFTGTYRLHKALLESGVQSKILVRDTPKVSSFINVEVFNQRSKQETLWNRMMARVGYDTTFYQKRRRCLSGLPSFDHEFISFPFSDYDITESPLYQKADIINFQWIGDFLDYKTFFKKNKKPVVWTIRDAGPFLGIFHLENDQKKCPENWNELNKRFEKFKSSFLNAATFPIHIITLSNYLSARSRQSSIFQKFNNSIIPNCIDSNFYVGIDRKEARRLLNISDDKIVLCFVADSINRYNKGFSELKKSIENINYQEIVFLSVGKGSEVFSMNINHRHLGELNDKQLQTVYSASDAFIFPTHEEALGNVMLEAMVCGTPVIGTPVGGLLDVIKDGFNGILSHGISSFDLKIAIEKFIQIRHNFSSFQIRQYMVDNFSPKKIADEYIKIYKSLLNI